MLGRPRAGFSGLTVTVWADADALAEGIVSEDQLAELNNVLNSLERYWSRIVNFAR